MIVASGKNEYRIHLKADIVKDYVKPVIKPRKRVDDGYTRLSLSFQRKLLRLVHQSCKEIVFATSIVNPQVKTKYNIFGDEGVIGGSGTVKRMKKVILINCYMQNSLRTSSQIMLGQSQTLNLDSLSRCSTASP